MYPVVVVSPPVSSTEGFETAFFVCISVGFGVSCSSDAQLGTKAVDLTIFTYIDRTKRNKSMAESTFMPM